MNGSYPSPAKRSALSRPWQSWQDELIRALPPDAAARRVGRTLPDVLERIRQLSKQRALAAAGC